MESVYVDESATAAIGSQVTQLAAQGLNSGGAVTAPLTVLPPAGADPVSLQASAAFAAQGAKVLAFDAEAQNFIAAAGAALTQIAATYGAVDGASAGTLQGAGTRIAGIPTAEMGTTIDPSGPPTTITPSGPPTPTNPSGPPTPITPSGPPTPTNPSGPPTPITRGYTPITPSASPRRDTPKDTEAAAVSDAGTAAVIPTTGTIPDGGVSTTTRPAPGSAK